MTMRVNVSPYHQYTTILPVNVWIHLAYTWDGTNFKQYINGVLDESVADGNSVPRDVGTSLFIGSNVTHAYRFQGIIDEVGIYTKAFTENELQRVLNYNFLSLPDTSGSPGDNILIPLSLKGGSALDSVYSFEARVTYDTTILDFTGIANAATYLTSPSIDYNETMDTIKIACAFSNPVTASQRLLNLQFTVSTSAVLNDTAELIFTEYLLNEDRTLTGGISGRVKIKTDFGDVSGNKNIEAFDASLILQHIVGISTLTPAQKVKADVTYNNMVTAYDAAYILKRVAGFILKFPVETIMGFKPVDSNENISVVIKQQKLSDIITLLLSFNDSDDIYALEAGFEYDNSCYTFEGFNREKIGNAFTIHNYTDGLLRLAVASAEPIGDTEKTVELKFRQVKSSDTPVISYLIVNDYEIDISKINIADELPSDFRLYQNYPNPFNPSTVIAFDLPEASNTVLEIYNLLGQKIRSLVSKDLSPGHHSFEWDGKNERGEAVTSGIYLYRLRADSFIKTEKMILLR